MLASPVWANDTLLSDLQRRAGGISTISCSFTQEKHLSLFDEVLLSEGKFIFERPSRLRWEYKSPFKSGFMLKDDSGIEWDEASGSQRPFTLQSSPAMSMVASQIMAWTTFDIPWLKSRYEIKQLSATPITLELRPLSDTAKKFLTRLVVSFSKDHNTVSVIELHEIDGDFTRIIFKNTQINTVIPESTFTSVR